jgi:hypothetical protein
MCDAGVGDQDQALQPQLVLATQGRRVHVFHYCTPTYAQAVTGLVPLAIWDASGLSEQPAAVLQCRKRNAQSQMSSTRTAMSCMASTCMI